MADWADELEGPGRNAAAALIDLFTSYGLDTLAPKIVEFVQQGYGTDTVTLLLQETSEYKKRFAANEKRAARGMPVLSPAEYLQVESGYRQALQAAGMPPGFYDELGDFTDWIERDISPSEIQDRANTARQVADTVDPLQREALARIGVSGDDLAAFYLDENRALPILQRQVQETFLAAERERAGFDYDLGVGQRLFDAGVEVRQAREGYSAIAQTLPTLERLSEIEQQDEPFTLADMESEVFEQDPEAAQQRRGLASRERARFQGRAGTGTQSLSRDTRFN